MKIQLVLSQLLSMCALAKYQLTSPNMLSWTAVNACLSAAIQIAVLFGRAFRNVPRPCLHVQRMEWLAHLDLVRQLATK